uniref:Serpin domain-containing protein n=1 Tax=Otus sunia TaxID=257818 RepID=A0A8C8AMR5_9STRI
MGSITAANAEFCFDVFKEVKVHHVSDNIFYSPLSIISALAMVYMGARGNTQSQIEKVSYLHGYKPTALPQAPYVNLKFTSFLVMLVISTIGIFSCRFFTLLTLQELKTLVIPR